MLCEPLKKLVAKQGVLGAKLLRGAVADENGGNERMMRFVQQVVTLRGGRKTGEIAKEFWVGSRGRHSLTLNKEAPTLDWLWSIYPSIIYIV
jgi:hypothetical protein